MNQQLNDEQYKPLHYLAKKIYLNLKKLKSMSDAQTQVGGAGASDESWKPLAQLAKSTYLDLKELKRLEKSLGIN